ncbi:MAG: vanadium-dependent haloperoxidase [Sphingobacteriales bacterium]|nr:vanadium-dependent haloperoxidase [Sphingobacteriales bacterium]
MNFSASKKWVKVFIPCFLFFGHTLFAQSKEKTLHELNSLLINAVMDDLFNPPVASRIYTYPNIAFYECIRRQDAAYPSLAGKLNGLEQLPSPANEKQTDYFVAAAVSFSHVGQALIGSEYKFEDWRKQFIDSLKTGGDSIVLENSVQYGKQLANAVIAWMKKDNYGETRAMMRYVYTKKEGRWQPTPVDFAAALEPNWGYMRPMTLKNSAQFSPKQKLVFNPSKKSVFYKNIMEVYKIGKTLDSVKTAIAWYWDDNPNISVEKGHLNYFLHKISPGGHWIMITRQACLEKNVPLLKAAQAYALTSVAIYDGIISCWFEKFQQDLVRPVTYIKKHIDEKWDPLIQTPPFPEFTSGHAVLSNAAAAVLTKLFGENYSFTDNTEIPFDIRPRTFSSFYKAAEESSWSRVYGGIHYPETARISIKQGRLIGQYVLNKLLSQAETKTK